MYSKFGDDNRNTASSTSKNSGKRKKPTGNVEFHPSKYPKEKKESTGDIMELDEDDSGIYYNEFNRKLNIKKIPRSEHTPVFPFTCQNDEIKRSKWGRPKCPDTVYIQGNEPDLHFLNTDIDAVTEFPPPQITNYNKEMVEYLKHNKQLPVIRLYGVTGNGNSVMSRVYGFFPYFYITISHTQKMLSLDEDQLKNFIPNYLQNKLNLALV